MPLGKHEELTLEQSTYTRKHENMLIMVLPSNILLSDHRGMGMKIFTDLGADT